MQYVEFAWISLRFLPFRIGIFLRLIRFLVLAERGAARIPQDDAHVRVAGEMGVGRLGEVVVPQDGLVDVHGAWNVIGYGIHNGKFFF